jgi:hypothetical protein
MGVVAGQALAIVRGVGHGADFPGQLTTSFFLVGSVTAALLGSRLDRFGARPTALTAAAATTFIALPILSLSTSAWLMMVVSGVAGGAFALILPATNAVLSAALPPERLVLAVCIKQAAIPGALTLAAAAAPLLRGSGAGRSFLAADGLALLALIAFATVTTSADPALPSRPEARARAPRSRVLRYAIGTMLASVLAGALIGYGAISLHAAGLSEHDAARVLAFGNLAGIATRVLSGWCFQRWRLTSWWPVTAMAWSGAVGALGLTSHEPVLATAGALVAFALGWGWSGLTFALVLVASGDRPGASGAMLQTGGMLGSALGPVVVASAVGLSGLTAGWVLVALAMLIAGALFAPRRRPAPNLAL